MPAIRRLLLLLVLLGVTYFAVEQAGHRVDAPDVPVATRPADEAAWHDGQEVSGAGTVTRILSDDRDGSRHQRFILTLASGRTLLIAHNIDVAPRVAGLAVGDRVSFKGEYASNPQGGVIHWTHHDPQGRHPGGWLEHAGRRYD